ncbi:MAG: cysteinyl-tRNA synthetase [Actinomycetota bacterium]|nr:cysteinyl-tRNA synthetase [Actinomycetota bacterium]
MPIQIHETMTRGIRPLETREPGKVGMYACGPTVYNYVHIGNARTLIWFDFIKQYLVYRGYEVTYVTNYTDVDDKIIERAKLEGISPDAVALKYTRAFEADMNALRVQPPDLTCKATDHIEDMVAAIEGLVEKGAAYDAAGDVFFSIESFPSYGKLSGRSLDDMRAGERVEPHEGKRHPLDFALWKSAKEGEPAWPSPWGPGRPGWHIECSVMSTKYLGMGFDIHGGGSDLIFPHHENEIAQAEALTGTEPFVRNWMHSGMVQMDAQKMSKSLGNFVLAKDIVARYGGEPVRYWALMSSYGSQAAFTESSLGDASAAYERWRTFHGALRHSLGEFGAGPPTSRAENETLEDVPGSRYLKRFIEAMDDNFNSSEAFAAVHELVGDGNKLLENDPDGEELRSLGSTFVELTNLLGFSFAGGGDDSELVSDLVDLLIELREEARAEKAFDRADAIRERLAKAGVTIEDRTDGTRWRLSAVDHTPSVDE